MLSQVIAQQSKLSAIAQQERAGRAEALRVLDQLRAEKEAAQQANDSLWQHMAEVLPPVISLRLCQHARGHGLLAHVLHLHLCGIKLGLACCVASVLHWKLVCRCTKTGGGAAAAWQERTFLVEQHYVVE